MVRTAALNESTLPPKQDSISSSVAEDEEESTAPIFLLNGQFALSQQMMRFSPKPKT